MAKIAIVTSGGSHILNCAGRLALVAEILRGRGYEVVVIEPDRPAEPDVSFDGVWIDKLCPAPHGGDIFGMEIRARPAEPAAFECKVDFDWKRERDYPTLKQGLRMPHIKRRGK